ncbi:MAG: aminotransferase, partial [Gammaproteobacteria bacterium]|nr:aminotransferase [Gammaproteobacteria bacterium]
QIKAWGVQNIAASLADINARIARQLAQLGCRLPDDAQRCPHMFGAQLPPSYSGNLVAELKARHIYISQRGNALRFAPHLHVNEQDVERLLASLGELIA